jgi:hypothetical protein
MDVQIISFPNNYKNIFIIKEYSLIGKTRSFKLQISGSSQDALDTNQNSLT